MKKFEEPIVKVVKFKAMDVIATSGDTPQGRFMSVEGGTYESSGWYKRN